MQQEHKEGKIDALQTLNMTGYLPEAREEGALAVKNLP